MGFLPMTFGYFNFTELHKSILNSTLKAVTMTPYSFYYYMKYGPTEWGGQYLKKVENEKLPLLFLYSVKDRYGFKISFQK